MSHPSNTPREAPTVGRGVATAGYLLAAAGLVATLELKLLSAVLSGLLVYQLVHAVSPLLERRLPGQRARWAAVVALSTLIIGALSLAILGVIEHFRRDVPDVQRLLAQLMQIVDASRARLPGWLQGKIPVGIDDLRDSALAWLHEHGGELQQSGKNAMRGIAHVLLGMILGAIVAIGAERQRPRLPLAAALAARVDCLAEAFRRVVFAQVKISAINTTFSAIYLLAALPLFHARLPLSKTLVMITFIAGLLPVIGHLISNTLIVLISLSVGLGVAAASLVFLVVIHKLEYFLNARIVGGEIESRAWELLMAMIAMEAAFGIAGVIAAPIYYAYLKRELILAKLV